MRLRRLHFIDGKAEAEGPDAPEIGAPGTAECDRTRLQKHLYPGDLRILSSDQTKRFTEREK